MLGISKQFSSWRSSSSSAFAARMRAFAGALGSPAMVSSTRSALFGVLLLQDFLIVHTPSNLPPGHSLSAASSVALERVRVNVRRPVR